MSDPDLYVEFGADQRDQKRSDVMPTLAAGAVVGLAGVSRAILGTFDGWTYTMLGIGVIAAASAAIKIARY
jgi:hypothetical protein